jgi:pimeloyl-ACP methyl ester carboxylesterase
MKLFYRKLGQGEKKLIVMHGLYGASDNWYTIAKQLSRYFEVYIVDLRNHGRSPQVDTHTYHEMSKDILELMKDNCLSKTTLLGHSMGGKVAMHFAFENPKLVESMIIVDIAPKNYSKNRSIAKHKEIIDGMLKIDLSLLKKREDLKHQLSAYLSNDFTYHFITKNLRQDKNKAFSWKLNLPVLAKEIKNIADGFSENDINNLKIKSPVLFIKGENSNYIQKQDYKTIAKLFPNSKIQEIKDVEHWIHAQKPQELVNMIIDFYKLK